MLNYYKNTNFHELAVNYPEIILKHEYTWIYTNTKK